MSIYGSYINEGFECYSVSDCFMEQVTTEGVSVVNELFGFGGVKIPDELKISENDIFSASAFKSKVNAIIKHLEKNNESEKKISKTVYTYYWAIVGNTFGGNCKKYEPKFSFYVELLNKYCTDKQKASIKKDMENTIAALDKLEEKGKTLSDLQKDYEKDIKASVGKIK